ncbi:MAG: insulinase family protein [Spirochaetales bacterium]|nr:insulinase family protein [Spirochaetales bacterium]
MIQIEKLDNGAVLLLENVTATDTVSIGFWLLAGARDENNNETGYSHFLEHMLFKGTERRNAFQISSEIDRVGGILNAFTEKETCCYYCTIPSEHIQLAIDVLSDMLFHSTFPEEEIGKERGVIINEIQISQDSPDEKAYELYLKEIWGDHPLSRRITGSIYEVKKITREKLYQFHNERYILSNLIISISGKYNKEEVKDSLLKVINNRKQGSFHTTRQMPGQASCWKLIKDRFTQSHVYTGITIPFSGELNDFYSLLVFSTLFGESMSSRLYQNIREEKGLCYTIFCFRSYYSDLIQWTIYANTGGTLTISLIQSIGKVLKSLFTLPLSNSELEDAKSHLKGSLVLAKENMEVRMKRLFKLYQINKKALEFEDSIKILGTITRDDVQKIIDSYIKADKFNLLVLGNKNCGSIKNIKFEF